MDTVHSQHCTACGKRAPPAAVTGVRRVPLSGAPPDEDAGGSDVAPPRSFERRVVYSEPSRAP
jgi:hypothetical protein